jgi:ribonuclease P protein component
MIREAKQKKSTFNKRSRLLKSNEFNRVFTSPDLKLSNNLLLLLAHKSPLTYARLGLVVPKKKTPLAVNRNRFKRLAREYFRANKEKLGSLDIVILCRLDLSKLTKKEQNQKFAQIFSSISKNDVQ